MNAFLTPRVITPDLEGVSLLEVLDLRDDDITGLVNPGQTHNIDYGVSNATGTSNYWVSSQLVSYSSPNHTLDAAVVDVLSPTNQILMTTENHLTMKL